MPQRVRTYFTLVYQITWTTNAFCTAVALPRVNYFECYTILYYPYSLVRSGCLTGLHSAKRTYHDNVDIIHCGISTRESNYGFSLLWLPLTTDSLNIILRTKQLWTFYALKGTTLLTAMARLRANCMALCSCVWLRSRAPGCLIQIGTKLYSKTFTEYTIPCPISDD